MNQGWVVLTFPKTLYDEGHEGSFSLPRPLLRAKDGITYSSMVSPLKRETPVTSIFTPYRLLNDPPPM